MVLALAVVGLVLFTFICGCPCRCIACNDSFTRADADDINSGSPCGWTEVAGNWTIASNALRTTASNAIAICTTATSDSSHAIRVSGCRTDTAGDLLWVILDYQDSSNFHFAEVKIHSSSGYLKLRRMTVGVPTDLATTNINLATNTATEILACIDKNQAYMTAQVAQAGGVFDAVSTGITVFGGTQGGLGTGAIAGTVDFGGLDGLGLDGMFQFYATNALCGSCAGLSCGSCDLDGDTRITPQIFKVVIAGVTNGTCMLCASTNATWYVDRGSTTLASDCIYSAGGGGSCFGGLIMELKTNNQIKVHTTLFGTDRLVWLEAATSGFIDCDELVDRSVPYSSSDGLCTGTGSTCLVTSW